MENLKDIPEPIVIFGRNGQVGRALTELAGAHAIALDRTQADLAEPDGLNAILSELKPGCIINAAAYTAVDRAEEEPELALSINADAVAVMAEYAFANDIPFIHYSTDYVFPGEGEAAYTEADSTDPVNEYGRTKLLGEKKIQDLAAKYDSAKWCVFRTSWVYDAIGKNFFNSMVKLGEGREVLSVVSDQIGAPTYAPDIARFSLQALSHAVNMEQFPSGIYHLCNAGETSWFAFAESIFKEALQRDINLMVKEVRPISSSAFPTLAKRPHNSRLCIKNLEKTFGIIIPDWEDALERCFSEKIKHKESFEECVA